MISCKREKGEKNEILIIDTLDLCGKKKKKNAKDGYRAATIVARQGRVADTYIRVALVHGFVHRRRDRLIAYVNLLDGL